VSSINRIAWMWDEALQALERAERQHRRFYGLAAIRALPVWEPPADVFESDSEVIVSIALPGVSPESITVQVTTTGLVVSAERAHARVLESMHVRRLEIPYGRFERSIELAGGHYVLAERSVDDGCLTLRLTKE
jgi:HSP20 family protein